jgi:hypothetical protein
MRRGVRWINGQEYLLCGRHGCKEFAEREAMYLRKSWLKVRIIKRHNWDFMLYVHGAR